MPRGITLAVSLASLALLNGGCGNSANYRVPSPAMEPTLKVGARVKVDTQAYRNHDPRLGDIVILHPPAGAAAGTPTCGDPAQGGGRDQACDRPTTAQSSQNFIKRIVAGPGDTIAIVDGRVIRNGKPQAEPYARPCGALELCRFPKPITIPKGYWFMMGDNRGASDDSRFWGPVPTAWIVGKVASTS